MIIPDKWKQTNIYLLFLHYKIEGLDFDILQITSNCEIYNLDGATITELARELVHRFQSIIHPETAYTMAVSTGKEDGRDSSGFNYNRWDIDMNESDEEKTSNQRESNLHAARSSRKRKLKDPQSESDDSDNESSIDSFQKIAMIRLHSKPSKTEVFDKSGQDINIKSGRNLRSKPSVETSSIRDQSSYNFQTASPETRSNSVNISMSQPQSYGRLDRELKLKMYALIRIVEDADKDKIFAEPVDINLAPNYLMVVSRPMDLSTIR
jgi:hypothetical protein